MRLKKKAYKSILFAVHLVELAARTVAGAGTGQ